MHKNSKTMTISVTCVFHSLVVSLLLILAATEYTQAKEYLIYDIAKDCPTSGKRELSINTGAAILYINENVEATYKILKRRDITCHFELETLSKDYGFHIYFDEMNIDASTINEDNNKCNVNANNNKCKDYVQFARDVVIFDTYHSCKYCGYREKIHYESAVYEDYNRIKKQGKRLYIEGSADGEMDVYFKMSKQSDRTNNFNRTIRIIATIYKKSCKHNDQIWKQCDHTNQCVKRDFFCDRYPNCAWPHGEIPTDELECDGYAVTIERHGGHTMASRIPVIIIVTIIGIGCFVLIFIVVRRCFKVYRVMQLPARPKPPDDEETETPLRNLDTSNQTGERETASQNRLISQSRNNTIETVPDTEQRNIEPNPSNISSNEGEETSTLPSYEEAVQSPYVPNIRYADDNNDERGDPPPYSPEMT